MVGVPQAVAVPLTGMDRLAAAGERLICWVQWAAIIAVFAAPWVALAVLGYLVWR